MPFNANIVPNLIVPGEDKTTKIKPAVVQLCVDMRQQRRVQLWLRFSYGLLQCLQPALTRAFFTPTQLGLSNLSSKRRRYFRHHTPADFKNREEGATLTPFKRTLGQFKTAYEFHAGILDALRGIRSLNKAGLVHQDIDFGDIPLANDELPLREVGTMKVIYCKSRGGRLNDTLDPPPELKFWEQTFENPFVSDEAKDP
ncbi:hypothetical protein DXG01_013260 [Tephrocybe rancida]|nr:hypothetical protein DXG01_013260 [Tephrocybe rancida]